MLALYLIVCLPQSNTVHHFHSRAKLTTHTPSINTYFLLALIICVSMASLALNGTLFQKCSHIPPSYTSPITAVDTEFHV